MRSHVERHLHSPWPRLARGVPCQGRAADDTLMTASNECAQRSSPTLVRPSITAKTTRISCKPIAFSSCRRRPLHCWQRNHTHRRRWLLVRHPSDLPALSPNPLGQDTHHRSLWTVRTTHGQEQGSDGQSQTRRRRRCLKRPGSRERPAYPLVTAQCATGSDEHCEAVVWSGQPPHCGWRDLCVRRLESAHRKIPQPRAEIGDLGGCKPDPALMGHGAQAGAGELSGLTSSRWIKDLLIRFRIPEEGRTKL